MERLLTAFLISFVLMFVAHEFLESTWGPEEPRSHPARMIFNYTVGTLGIYAAFFFLHPALWLDLAVCISGAGSATIAAHWNDFYTALVRWNQADELIQRRKD